MKYFHDVIMFKGPRLQINQQQSDQLEKLLTATNPPKFIRLNGEVIAISNIAQVERMEPEPGQMLAEPEQPEEPMQPEAFAKLRQKIRELAKSKSFSTNVSNAAVNDRPSRAEIKRAERELAEHAERRRAQKQEGA